MEEVFLGKQQSFVYSVHILPFNSPILIFTDFL